MAKNINTVILCCSVFLNRIKLIKKIPKKRVGSKDEYTKMSFLLIFPIVFLIKIQKELRFAFSYKELKIFNGTRYNRLIFVFFSPLFFDTKFIWR